MASKIYYEKDTYGNLREKVNIEDSNFIYTTNFQGNPERDKYGSTERKAKIKVDEVFAEELRNIGVKVGQTKWEEPEYYVTIKLNFNFWKSPNVYLVTDKKTEPLTENNVALVDDADVQNVRVKCSTRESEMGKTLYIDTMYVEQALSTDPWYGDYHQDEECIPFS